MSGQIYPLSQNIPVVQGFLASAVKGTGLTVTVQVLRDGVSLIAAGQATAEIGSTGFYLYTIPLASTGVAGLYTVIFTTAGTADQKVLAQSVQVGSWIDSIDDILTSVGADINGDLATVDASLAVVDASLAVVDTNVDLIVSVVQQYPGVNVADLPNYQRVGGQVSSSLGSGVYTPVVPSRANGVFAQVTVHDVYYTLDGSTPTSSSGFKLVDSATPFFIPLGPGIRPKWLRSASGSVLNLQYVNVKSLAFSD